MHFMDSPDFLNGLAIPGNNWFRRFAVTYALLISEPRYFSFKFLVERDWLRYFSNSDTITDAKMAILKVCAASPNPPTINFSWFPPMVAKYGFSDHPRKKSERLSYLKFHFEQFDSIIESIFLMVREIWRCQINDFPYCITKYCKFNNFGPIYLWSHWIME